MNFAVAKKATKQMCNALGRHKTANSGAWLQVIAAE